MTCDVKHTMVKSKALSNPPNPLQILGSSACFKNQYEKTYSCKLDLKGLKPAPGSGLGLSLFIYTPNSKQQAYWLLPRKNFQNNYLGFTLQECFSVN